MTFAHGALFAVGASCVAIPIVIHLLARRRRTPVRWGAMRFLLEAYRKQRRRLTLEQWLLLAARCLVVLLAAAAIARPMLDAAGALGPAGSRSVYLVVDTSLASSALDGPGASSALDRHKRRAASLLEGLGGSDRAGLVTTGAPAEAVVTPPTADVAGLRGVIERLTATDGPADWAGALRAVAADIAARGESGGPATVVLLSDFLVGSADLSQALPSVVRDLPTGVRVTAAASSPASAAAGNVQVVGVEPLRSVALVGEGGGERARVLLRRTGAATGEAGVTTVRVRVSAPGAGDGSGSASESREVVRWSPGQSEATVSVALDASALELEGATSAAVVAEIDADAVAGDNVFRRPLVVRESLRVGVADRTRLGTAGGLDRMSPGDWLRLALRPTGATAVEVVDVAPAALDQAGLAGLEAVFVPRPDLLDASAWERLGRFADGGGVVVVSPAPDASSQVWTDGFVRGMGVGWRFAREVETVEGGVGLAAQQPRTPYLALIHAELEALAKPVTVSRLLAVEDWPGASALLTLRDGRAWAVAGAPGTAGEGGAGAGLVVYLASSPALSWTDLPAKPLMLPLVQEVVRQGAGRSAAAFTQEAGGVVRTPRRAVELRLVAGEGDGENLSVAVENEGRTASAVRRGGLFRAVDERGASRGYVAVNAAAGAGRTDVQPASAVGAWLGEAFARGGEEGGAGTVRFLEDGAGFEEAGAGEGDAGSPWSLPLLIAAGVLALLEAVMARWFSHAQREGSSEVGGSAGSSGGGGTAAAA